MDFITNQDARLLAWAESRLGEKFQPDRCRWVAGLVDGGLAWVVVFSLFSNGNCHLSLATDDSKRWASREMFRWVLAIPFKQWGLRRLTFIVSEKNEKSLAILRKQGRFSVGAVEEGRMRAIFPDGSTGVVFGLLKEECRWL